jgi:hypothetical protein
VTKLYIAGPMRGYDQFNFPAFDRAARLLRDRFHTVINPAELDRELGFDETLNELGNFNLKAAMVRDVQAIIDSDGIVLLPGWEDSEGAKFERQVAEQLGRRIFLWNEGVVGHLTLPAPTLGQVAEAAKDNESGLVEFKVFAADTPRPSYHNRDHAAEEVRVTNPETGGEKGAKPARFDLLPWDVLTIVAEQYGFGAAKYSDRNWEKGYAFSLSFAALVRHLAAYAQGEVNDPESGLPHMAAVIFHAMTLIRNTTAHPELNDLHG